MRFLKISLFLFHILFSISDSKNTDVIKFCDKLCDGRKLLLVSTLDGKLTALNINDGGSEKWNIPTDPGPLLSSNIHHVELAENNHFVRIIPSLSGGLYKFDGESIEPMPVNTDTLLKSHWDDMSISGGKEISSYAIDIERGQVLYKCTMHDCNNKTEDEYMSTDIILLKRETQKVRAVEMPSQTEKWIYSVGLHNLTVSAGTPDCSKNKEEFYIRAVVPKGLLYVNSKTNPEETLWEHQFDSPVVNAWTLIGSHLEAVDLFESLQTFSKSQEAHPTLYIGIHNEQLYIQESEPVHRIHLLLEETQFSLKKYRLIHALDIESTPDVVPLITDQSERNSSTTLAMLYGSNLVKGEGYYLYCAEMKSDCESERERLISSFSYWKEAITFLSIILVIFYYLVPCTNLVTFDILEMVKIIYAKLRRKQEANNTEEAMSSEFNEETGGVICNTEGEITNHKSRYLEDFEPIHCLGRGGFGVVFQARHKLTDCHYAIKRITLPDRKDAHDRVLREVKALANMEHQYIVRYFQSWEECPPRGWQEEQDKLWKNKTKNEYLNSEMDSSIISSLSHITRCNTSNPNITTMQKRTSNGKSDSLDIVFQDSNSKCDDRYNEVDQSKKTKTRLISVNRCEHNGANVCRRENIKCNKVYLYIQMQLCQKHSLREWLCDNLQRDQNVVLNIFDQIVQAVEYVHLQGLIHRDLKPSNIFFSPDGLIKVGDFGLVTEIAVNLDLITENGKSFVNGGRHTANVGTKLYMSPEQVLGYQYTYKVDIYSLGIIFFELLMPFSTQMERNRMLTNLRNDRFPRNFSTNHEHEYNLLKLMLSSEPDRRPTTYEIRIRPPLSEFHTANSIPFE